MRSAPEWLRKTWARALKFWHTNNPRMAIVRDVVAAAFVVGILLAGIWIYAGQPLSQAPVVSVESGSMMHGPFRGGKVSEPTGWDHPPFGRMGTIDPGDIVFVKDIDSWEDVEVAFGPGRRDGYGGHGDTVVFMPNGRSSQTRVIHRAMLYVEANPEGCTPRVNCTFRVPAACGSEFDDFAQISEDAARRLCEGTTDLITLNLTRDGLFLELTNFPCWESQTCGEFYSGFITKGDNNDNADQHFHVRISAPVRVPWIIGKARGEIPWFGLIKLALYGNPSYQEGASDPTRGKNWGLLKADAPWDIWLSLFLSLGVLVAIPMVLDLIGNLRARRKREEAERRRLHDEELQTPPKGPGSS